MDNLKLLLQEIGMIDPHFIHFLVIAPCRIQCCRDRDLALWVAREIGQEASESMAPGYDADSGNVGVFGSDELLGTGGNR